MHRAWALIFLVSLVIRFYGLTNSPPSLNWDEVSHGYNAYSILKTGSDEWGSYPIFNFRAYGDYPTTANLYLTIPFIALFGLNDFSVRLPTALLGSITPVIIFLICLELIKKIFTGVERPVLWAFICGLIFSISPWHILSSRAVFQSTIALFFVSCGFYLFIVKRLSLSLLFFTLSLFSYHTTRVVIPIFVLLLFPGQIPKLTNRKNFIFLISLMLFTLSSVYIILSPQVRARSEWVSIINDGAVSQIIENRLNSRFPPVLARLIYNRPLYFIKTASYNYFSYFNPKYLFFSGGTQYQYSVPGFGLLSPIVLPFFYLGFIWMLLKFKDHPETKPILTLLFISPLPAAITSGEGHVLRSSLLLPPIAIVASIGLYVVFQRIRMTPLKIIGLFTLLSSPFLYLYILNLFTTYKVKYSWSWQYGYKQAIEYVKNHPEYQTIITTKKYGEPHEFFLFYLKYDPAKLKKDPNLVRYAQSNWFWVDRFDKYWFLNDWQIKDLTTERGVPVELITPAILITSPGNFPSGWHRIETISFLDGQPAFEIYAKEN